MICKRCGAEVNPRTGICDNCGARYMPPQRQRQPQPSQGRFNSSNRGPVQAQQSHSTFQSKKKNTPLIIVSILAALFFILWLAKPADSNKRLQQLESENASLKAAVNHSDTPFSTPLTDISEIDSRFLSNEILSDTEYELLRKDELSEFSSKLLSLDYIKGAGKYEATSNLSSMTYDDIIMYSLSGREDGINCKNIMIDLPTGYSHTFEIAEIMLEIVGYKGDSSEIVNKIDIEASSVDSKMSSGEYNGLGYFVSFPNKDKNKITYQFYKDVK